MKTTTLTAAILAAALTTATPSAAIEYHELHRQGAWVVELVTHPSGSMNCMASSHNGRDTFSITAFVDGNIVLGIALPTTAHGRNKTDLTLDVDNERWTLRDVDLEANGEVFLAKTMIGGDEAVRLMTDMIHGTAMALKARDGDANMAAWSLAGTPGAVIALNDCKNRLPS